MKFALSCTLLAVIACFPANVVASQCTDGFPATLDRDAATKICGGFLEAREAGGDTRTCGAALDAAQQRIDPLIADAVYSCVSLEDYRQIMPCAKAMRPLRYTTYLHMLTIRAHCESKKPEHAAFFND